MALTETQQFHDAIRRATRILIAVRKDWTVDGIASALALARLIGSQGKSVDIVCDEFVPPPQLRFLPGIDRVLPAIRGLQRFVISLDVSKTKIDELSYDVAGDALRIFITPKDGYFNPKDVAASPENYRYDLIITVDAPDYVSLGRPFAEHADFFHKKPTVVIDSDPANERYGNINLVDVVASSSAEAVFRLFFNRAPCPEPGRGVDADAATCLLAGIIAKTRRFTGPDVSPTTLETASALTRAGARRDDIVQHLYRTRSIPTLKLWGRALSRLRHDAATKTVWTMLTREDFALIGAHERDLPDVIEELIAESPEAETACILYEQESPEERGKVSGICALVWSRSQSALRLVESLRPEGTHRLARVCFPLGTLTEAEKTVLETVRSGPLK